MNQIATAVGWFFGVILVAMVIYAMVRDAIETVVWRTKFIREFVSQDTVDRKLKTNAIRLKGLFDRQVEVQSQCASSSIATREQKAAEIAGFITEDKKKFWKMVELAKRAGFETPSTIDQALNKKCEQDIVAG